MTLYNWLGSMGGPTVNIEVEYDDEFHRVYVDTETLNVMVGSILLDGPLDDDGNLDMAKGLLEQTTQPQDRSDGKWDVTDTGGGWAYWQETRDAVIWGPDDKAGYFR